MLVDARRDQFEKAETHDDLWNAAQKQMTQHGKMHGFMRMVWALLCLGCMLAVHHDGVHA